MEELAKMVDDIEEAMAYFMEEENMTELQALYYMIEEFARTITKSKQHKILFYTALMQIIQDKKIDQSHCSNIIHSYQQAIQ